MTGRVVLKAPDMGKTYVAPGLTPGLNRRQQNKARTDARLKEAARFLFANAGYFDTTIRDVAQRMGMSTGAIFNHVQDKAGLWRYVMGGPAPSAQLAEEVALIEAGWPGWSWSLRKSANRYHAIVSEIGVPDASASASGVGESPASALRDARLWLERKGFRP